ncbi:MAG: hypothetical protein KBT12_05050 [Bacteroidales bacterium]|nr:hypothetical protein [Candidatus Physcousia equi]
MRHTAKLLLAVCALAVILTSCAGSKQHPDLTLYELKGEVRQVVVDIQNTDADKAPLGEPVRFTYTFAKDGSLLAEDDKTFAKEDLKRDENGRLIELQINQSGEVDIQETRSYTYTGSHAAPDTIFTRISGEFSNATTTSNTYDADGNLLAARMLEVFDGNTLESECKYQILERDAQGNWTKRFATITETEQLLDENCELGSPEFRTRYQMETRQITYWGDAEPSETPVLADGDHAGEAEPSIFDECYDKQGMEELIYYVALRDTRGHEQPEASSPTVEEQFYGKGFKVMAESGAASFSDYDKDWLEWSWRGESYYFKRADFERKSVQVCRRLNTNFIPSGKEMWFRADDGSTITLSIMEKNGHRFHPLEEGSQEVLGLNVGENVYLMQFGGEYGSEPYVLSEEEGFVKLCGMGSYISRSEGDVNDCDGVVIGSKLTCDAWHVVFPDPDFCFEVYYVPSEEALMLYGTLYRFDKTTDID